MSLGTILALALNVHTLMCTTLW